MENRNYPEAIKQFEASLAIDQDERYKAFALQLYGTCLMEQHQYPEANAKFEEALRIDTDNYHKAVTLQVYAERLREQGRHSDAEQKYQQSLAIDSDSEHRAITLNAYAYFLINESHDYAGAEHLLSRELLNYPPNHSLRFTWLLALVKMGKVNTATTECEKLVQSSPRNPELHNQRANIMKEMQRWKDAEQAYRNALQLTKRNWERAKYLTNVAKLILEMGALDRYDEAIALCDEAHRISPRFRWSLKAKEELLKDKGLETCIMDWEKLG